MSGIPKPVAPTRPREAHGHIVKSNSSEAGPSTTIALPVDPSKGQHDGAPEKDNQSSR